MKTDIQYTIYQGDIPDDLVKIAIDDKGGALIEAVAIDTETMGLNHHRDRLCVIQFSFGDNHSHLVQIAAGQKSAPNLKKIFEHPNILKLFHFARFDLAILEKALGILAYPCYCTKIASKLARTYTDRHGLADLVAELLNITLDKGMQSSNWGAEILSEDQCYYAALDVRYLHQLRDKLNQQLNMESRAKLAQPCFDFLRHRIALDLAGWAENDIFAHR